MREMETVTYLTEPTAPCIRYGGCPYLSLVVNGAGYTFVSDTTAGITAVVEEVTPAGSVYYYRDPGGSLVARRQGMTGSDRRYYHFDEIGSTRLLTDLDGDRQLCLRCLGERHWAQRHYKPAIPVRRPAWVLHPLPDSILRPARAWSQVL